MQIAVARGYVNIKYAVSAYPDSCGYRCDFGYFGWLREIGA